MTKTLLAFFFAPAVWLSGRLSFSLKYLLIGVVALFALGAFSIPMWQQTRADYRFARLEREGLKQFDVQAQVLAALVTLRSQTACTAASNASAPPPALTQQGLVASIEGLLINARQAGLIDESDRLEKSWKPLRDLNEQEYADRDRERLSQTVEQANALSALLKSRTQPVCGQSGKAAMTREQLGISMDNLIVVARQHGINDSANRLEKNWESARRLDEQEDPQLRFAAQTSAINALLGLMQDSAHGHRLNIDPDLDIAFDMLANQLPLVQETLARQLDAVNLKTGVLASYAQSAQLALSEATPALKAGMAQLAEKQPDAAALPQALSLFLTQIARQQAATGKALNGDQAALADLRQVAMANGDFARSLLHDATAATDSYLQQRFDRLLRSQWIIAVLLIGTIFAIAYLFGGIYLSTMRSLKRLSDGTVAFCSGHLDTRIRIDTRDELVLVAQNFNTVADEFGHLLEVIREQNESRERELEKQVMARTAELAEKNEQLRAVGDRVQEELKLAHNMQLAILPQVFPDEPGWAVHACMFPARELGGDFYDGFMLPDGRYGFLVADVSGKGVGAAFFMAVSRTVLLDLALTGQPPGTVLAQANNLLCERNPMELFVTVCYGIFDPRDGSFTYASAGHHAPLLRKADGTVLPLASARDLALAIMPGMDYCNLSATLAPGDTLVLYTDGVTEAFSPEDVEYGDDRLHAWLHRALPQEGAADLVASLVRDVEEFVNGAEASDDLTCLILCLK